VIQLLRRNVAASIFLVGVICAGLILTGRAWNATTSGTSDTAERRVFSASWEESYRSLDQLTSAAEFIVVGTVKAEATTDREDFRAGDLEGGVLVFTDFGFQVTEVLKGAINAESIIVHQTGGRDHGVLMEAEDDPLLEVGAEYVLYLHFDEVGGRYFVVGGPDGRLVVEDGKASSLSQAFPDREISGVSWGGWTDHSPSHTGSYTAGWGYLNYHYTSAYDTDGYPLANVSIASHELGHLLGLAHEEDLCAIMNGATADRFFYCTIWGPQTDDVNGVNAIY
jgi:hypothetical protein